MPNKHKLFVYGSLKRGHWNFRLLENSHFVGTATTTRPYLLMDFGGFPGMYNQGIVGLNDVAHVKGELYEVDDATLRSCDCLEGHPTMYKRTPIEVRMNTRGNPIKCETYFYQGHIHGVVCTDGVWPRIHKLEKV